MAGKMLKEPTGHRHRLFNRPSKPIPPPESFDTTTDDTYVYYTHTNGKEYRFRLSKDKQHIRLGNLGNVDIYEALCYEFYGQPLSPREAPRALKQINKRMQNAQPTDTTSLAISALAGTAKYVLPELDNSNKGHDGRNLRQMLKRRKCIEYVINNVRPRFEKPGSYVVMPGMPDNPLITMEAMVSPSLDTFMRRIQQYIPKEYVAADICYWAVHDSLWDPYAHDEDENITADYARCDLEVWFLAFCSKIKNQLMSMHFYFGSMGNNKYTWFLERCSRFRDEFVSKINTVADVKAKVDADVNAKFDGDIKVYFTE